MIYVTCDMMRSGCLCRWVWFRLCWRSWWRTDEAFWPYQQSSCTLPRFLPNLSAHTEYLQWII